MAAATATVIDIPTLLITPSTRWSLILPSVLLCLVATLVPLWLRRGPLPNVPVIGKELGGEKARRKAYIGEAPGAIRLYRDGYNKFKNQLFKITTPRESPTVVVPPSVLGELRRLPDDVLSFAEAIHEQTHAEYTGSDAREIIIPHAIKTNLTPSLVRLNPSIAEEVAEAIRLEIPPCASWTPIKIYDRLLRIVAMVSGRVFIGPELCHDEAYIDAAINFTLEQNNAMLAIDPMPNWLRPWLAPRLPEIRRLEKRREAAYNFLKPVVEQRLKMDQKPDDLLSYLMDSQLRMHEGVEMEAAVRNIAKMQLGLSFGAIHTTTLTTTNAFYNLAVMPDVADELRTEIRAALAENDGVWNSHALQNMKKLDSFLKETLRYHPAGVTSFPRKVLKPFRLSNGQEIPAGVILEVAAEAVSRDPEVYEHPDQFDAFRFYRMRQRLKDDGSEEGAAQNQMVSVTQSSLVFGYGRHACPGRFFAANEIKMIMANVLLQYDVKNADGSTERYKNLDHGMMSLPDSEKELLFKRAAT